MTERFSGIFQTFDNHPECRPSLLITVEFNGGKSWNIIGSVIQIVAPDNFKILRNTDAAVMRRPQYRSCDLIGHEKYSVADRIGGQQFPAETIDFGFGIDSLRDNYFLILH